MEHLSPFQNTTHILPRPSLFSSIPLQVHFYQQKDQQQQQKQVLFVVVALCVCVFVWSKYSQKTIFARHKKNVGQSISLCVSYSLHQHSFHNLWTAILRQILGNSLNTLLHHNAVHGNEHFGMQIANTLSARLVGTPQSIILTGV